jgi:hypothetical protein
MYKGRDCGEETPYAKLIMLALFSFKLKNNKYCDLNTQKYIYYNLK